MKSPADLFFKPVSMAQLDAHQTGDQEIAGSEIELEIFSMVILFLPLI